MDLVYLTPRSDTNVYLKELRFRVFGSRYELMNYLGISMLTMVRDDMFAHMLVAVLERRKTANRNVYDSGIS